jgi:hypothetical protein
MHPGVAMQILRHSMIAVTMEIYTEVPLGRDPRRAAEVRPVARQLGVAMLRCCTARKNGPIPELETGR